MSVLAHRHVAPGRARSRTIMAVAVLAGALAVTSFLATSGAGATSYQADPSPSAASTAPAPRFDGGPDEGTWDRVAPAPRAAAPVERPAPAAAPDSGGFDWLSAAVGAGGAGLLILMLLGGASYASHRRVGVAR